MLVHSDVFERFTQGDTIPVMTQAVMENALSPRIIDQLFEDITERQYTRDLLFSSIVEVMSLVVCRIQPSINAAYVKNAVPINVSLQALYRKIGRIETSVGSALVRMSDQRLTGTDRDRGGLRADAAGHQRRGRGSVPAAGVGGPGQADAGW